MLIVGQGLAGSLLAWRLMQQGFKVLLLDDGRESASQVAAGLINPITGQRLVKQQDFEVLATAAMADYQRLAKQFDELFFIALPMLRILQTEQERQQAQRRLAQSGYQGFLSELVSPPEIYAPFGVLQQQQTGYLRTEALLEHLCAYFIEHKAYRQVSFDHADIRLVPSLQWQDVQPQNVVFCEGYRASQNPWFKCLPFQSAKGEILAGDGRPQNLQQILNFGRWFIPLEGDRFKLGATFVVDQLDTDVTREARDQLLQAFNRVVPGHSSLRLYQQRAGIRPCTLDKQPFIGFHPRHPQLAIFNGFGAKGSLAIPWYAARFADVLQRRAALPFNCDIKRYDDRFFSEQISTRPSQAGFAVW